jgi:hypothetical protein
MTNNNLISIYIFIRPATWGYRYVLSKDSVARSFSWGTAGLIWGGYFVGQRKDPSYIILGRIPLDATPSIEVTFTGSYDMSLQTNITKLRGVAVGEYGKNLTIILVDLDGKAQNVSAYTGISVVTRSPDAKKTLTSTGYFTSDGVDGSVYWAYTSTVYPDRPGIWDGQINLTKTGTVCKSFPFQIEVERNLL